MIISNSKKFIFIHIPKCGGTSVSSFFERRLLPQDITLNLNPHQGWEKYLEEFRNKFNLFKHSTALEIADAMGHEYFCKYHVFTFCRNPFSRAYSAFTFTKKADALYRPNSKRYQEIKDMNFEEFLSSEYMQDKKMLPAQPQINWVQKAPNRVHYHKLEEIESALGTLSETLYGARGIDGSIPMTNFSSSEGEWKKMTGKSEELILELYDDDFVFFQYPRQIDRA